MLVYVEVCVQAHVGGGGGAILFVGRWMGTSVCVLSENLIFVDACGQVGVQAGPSCVWGLFKMEVT